VIEQFFRIMALYKSYRKVSYRDFFQRRVQAGVSVDFVKIIDRNKIIGAFVFQQIPCPENSRDIFLDFNIFFFFTTTQSIRRGSVVSWNSG